MDKATGGAPITNAVESEPTIAPPDRAPRPPAIPTAVWALGVVSMLMDCSSEMIHAVLPLFLATSMGVSPLGIGLIEGVAEATAAVLKVVSGAFSDLMARRKPLALIGYGLAALSKPLFPLATSVVWIAAARMIDRVGKGVRGAPRDALVADLTPPAMHGRAFGLRQSLDTLGAIAGPAFAVAIMTITADNHHMVFWIATIPAILSTLVLARFVHEPPRERPPSNSRPGLAANLRACGSLPRAFWSNIVVAALVNLARLAEAFLILRAADVTGDITLAPLVVVVMNVFYAMSAFPAGVMSDRLGRRWPVVLGIIALLFSHLMLGLARDWLWMVMGAMAWGAHMGLTQGTLAASVADAAPPPLRGTAFGVFHLVSGAAMIAAGAMAGATWTFIGPAMAFGVGGACALAALVTLLVTGFQAHDLRPRP